MGLSCTIEFSFYSPLYIQNSYIEELTDLGRMQKFLLILLSFSQAQTQIDSVVDLEVLQTGWVGESK